jgi:hypothetical protein
MKKDYRKSKPYGMKAANYYDASDELHQVINKRSERRNNKVNIYDYI